VRLKWFVDLVAEAERLAPVVPASELAARVAEWGAREPFDFVVRILAAGFPAEAHAKGDPERWLAAGCPEAASRPARAAQPPTGATPPIAALDFRREALVLWPRWLWPPRASWTERAPGVRGAGLLARRLLHAGAVLLRSVASVLLLPAALLARPLLRGSRRRRRRAALAPERVLDVVAAWRRSEASETLPSTPGGEAVQ